MFDPQTYGFFLFYILQFQLNFILSEDDPEFDEEIREDVMEECQKFGKGINFSILSFLCEPQFFFHQFNTSLWIRKVWALFTSRWIRMKMHSRLQSFPCSSNESFFGRFFLSCGFLII